MPTTNKRKPISAEAALARAAALCSRSEQAESDVRTKILGWGVTPDDCDKILARLKSENFLSEERYARAYARDKFAFNGWGRQKIAFMLKAKGVSKPVIEAAIGGIAEADYHATLIKLLNAKARAVAGREPQQARAALLRLAASRGFEPSVFYPAVSQVLGDNADDYDQPPC